MEIIESGGGDKIVGWVCCVQGCVSLFHCGLVLYDCLSIFVLEVYGVSVLCLCVLCVVCAVNVVVVVVWSSQSVVFGSPVVVFG